MAADTSVTELADGIGPGGQWAVFDLGGPNWNPAWIPDLTTAAGTTNLSASERLDIVVLCDGYTSTSDFVNDLGRWIDRFYQLDVFDWFRGAVRIRGVYTPSANKAGSNRESFYRVELTPDERGISFSGWYREDGDDNEHFRARVWEVLDALGVNTTVYPSDLDDADRLRLNDTYSHLAVAMLVQTTKIDWASGRAVTCPLGPSGERLKIGIGNNWIHEAGHAFAYLADEYINRRGQETSRSNPDEPGLYNITNTCFSPTVDGCWWTHLSPFGDFPRANPRSEPSAVVGWLWPGNYHELGVWHAEYQCLMNGTHTNYCHSPDDDDTLESGADGANLRIRYRFCMWCQELVAMRFLEKAGALREPGDPSTPTARLGRDYLRRWQDTWRRRYYTRFDIGAQIADREATYAAGGRPTRCSGSPPLEESPLYEPQQAPAGDSGPAVDWDVATWLPLFAG
jgi:hypothetical protein